MKHYRINQPAAVMLVLAFSASFSVVGAAEASVSGGRPGEGPSVSAESWHSLLACLTQAAKQMHGGDDAASAAVDTTRSNWPDEPQAADGGGAHQREKPFHPVDEGSLHLMNLPPPML